MPFETLTLEVDGTVGLLTLNRPERLNAMNIRMAYELEDVVADLERTTGKLRVLVVTGAGRAFSAGADIKDRVENPNEPNVQRVGQFLGRAFRRMERLDTVCIAAVNGIAAGGGCELALACDLRIASTEARFALPEVKLGILPGAGGTQRLPRVVGATRAKEMMLFGEFIPAEQALAWGLVNRVTAPDQLIPTARAMARDLLKRPPLSLGMIKAAVNDGLEADLDTGLDLEKRCSMYLLNTEDRREGMAAFAEKREPRFQGR